MSPARRACCNQWLRTGINRSHVEQISPDKSMNFQCTTAAFTVSLKPAGFVISGSLAHETRPCMRCLSVGSHLCFRLPPHKPSRDCTCLTLVVIIGGLTYRHFLGNICTPHQIRCWFTYRGLSPHEFMPMPGVPNASSSFRASPSTRRRRRRRG